VISHTLLKYIRNFSVAKHGTQLLAYDILRHPAIPVGKMAQKIVWRSAFLLIQHSKYSATSLLISKEFIIVVRRKCICIYYAWPKNWFPVL